MDIKRFFIEHRGSHLPTGYHTLPIGHTPQSIILFAECEDGLVLEVGKVHIAANSGIGNKVLSTIEPKDV